MAQDPTSRFVNHAVGLRRLENREARRISRILDESFAQIVAVLARLDPTGITHPGNRRSRLQKLDREVREILNEAYRRIHQSHTTELISLAQIEQSFATRQLTELVEAVDVRVRPRTLSRSQWRALIVEAPVQGRVMGKWWAGQRLASRVGFAQQVRLGLAEGETLDQIVRRVRGRKVGRRFVGGVLSTSTRNAEALVRTAINQIANAAQQETYQANEDITEEYQYVATLDSRTSAICRATDGRIFRYDDPRRKIPPLHFACRSVTIPVVKWRSLKLARPPAGERASAFGPVQAGLDYGDWLRRQPAGVQDQILGVGKGKLFRAGKVSLRDLVRTDGTEIPLAELARRVA